MTTREADRPLQRYLVSARPVSSATDKPTPPPGTRPQFDERSNFNGKTIDIA
jgi:hypothetical protein